MKKSVIAALALSLVLMASAASAANVIGIFGEQGALTCSKAWTTPYASVTVYFVALLEPSVPTMSACEFGATGVTQAATGALAATPAWNTTLVIGNIMTPDGVALAFTTPLEAPLAYLGSIAYIGGQVPPAADFVMEVVPSGAGNLVVVDAETASEVPAEGWRMIINCVVGGPNGACQCEATIAAEEAAWGQIKALY